MDIIIKELRMQFKNPVLGLPTRPIEGHYIGRRVFAIVDGEDRHMSFTKEDVPMTATEKEITETIENYIQNEQEEIQN